MLHRKLVIRLTSQGLVLQPYIADQTQGPMAQALRVSWGTAEPVPLEWGSSGDDAIEPLSVDGVAGLLAGFADHYLLVITHSAEVATLPDPQQTSIRTVRTLLSIPLSSLQRAQTIVSKHVAKQNSRRQRTASVASTLGAWKRPGPSSADMSRASEAGDATPSVDQADDSDSESDTASSVVDEADAAPMEAPPIAKRPFWQRAFSRSKASPAAASAATESAQAERALPSDTSSETKAADEADPNEASPPGPVADSDLQDVAATATLAAPAAATGADKAKIHESQRELDRKLVAECMRTLTGMYFTYAGDITRSLQARHEAGSRPANEHLPQWRIVDRRYWFNRHLMTPFVRAGLHSYILVLMQGYCGAVTVPLPLKPYSSLSTPDPPPPASIDLDLTLVSRRSTERPGLRYQRRGVNDEGQVANFVETEFIISCEREGARHTCAFVQVRGSMPVYWSQSPFALKPPLVLERTPEESRAAMGKHLEGLQHRYGRLALVNLSEPTGPEGAVVNAYGDGVESLGLEEKAVRYLHWDFHRATRGFHYENLSQLVDLLTPELEQFSTFWATPTTVYSTQSGVVRESCVDCLDRTNVSQSAVARWVLRRHLVHLGITSGEEAGMHDDLDLAFNTLWADNGDAISREAKQYAGTSALKGDFTRTGRRDWRGAVHDASNSMARFLQGSVTDFFRQAALDYVLGVNPAALDEFATGLAARDPREVVRLQRIRQEAIDTAVREVLMPEEGEVCTAAWTLLSPAPGTDRLRPPSTKNGSGGGWEEKILILSDQAVHVVSYEYTLQKVSSALRIPLASLRGVQHGAYILSSLDASTRDPAENYGFALRYVDEDATEQIRTYSLLTTAKSTPSASTSSKPDSTAAEKTPQPATTRFIAFKALRRDAVQVTATDNEDGADPSATTAEGKTARDRVRSMIDHLRDAYEHHVAVHKGEGETAAAAVWTEEEKDLISVAESRAHTSVVDKLTHSLARAVWS